MNKKMNKRMEELLMEAEMEELDFSVVGRNRDSDRSRDSDVSVVSEQESDLNQEINFLF